MSRANITEDFKQIFENNNLLTNDNSLVKANEKYNKLLKEGLLKKRGYTLRGIEDAHLFRNKLNGNLLF